MPIEPIAALAQGRTCLGLELGSTRIKAVLIGPDHDVLAVGTHGWENQLIDGLWTYSLDAVWAGVQDCYSNLSRDVELRHGVELTTIGTIGVSAMMHGYLAFDADGTLVTPFRTWRNTNSAEAAARLSERLGYNIPHRWSAAHLYQAILDGEDHLNQLHSLTTLSGYVHWKLTGRQVLGIGDASGMFPVDTESGDYRAAMLVQFDDLAAEAGASIRLVELLPPIAIAGNRAGTLTSAGAHLLDPGGRLQAGIPFCPPEGDAGTGMVATNSVAPRTGNISAGTSIFAMVVLDRPLNGVHPELDLVTTPSGDLVAMAHCNNGASELEAWVGLFTQFARAMGSDPDETLMYETLYRAALDGSADCSGMLAFNNLSGEPITGLPAGRPLFLRTPGSAFDLTTFMRTHLFASLATLRIGLDILFDNREVVVERMFAHGGLLRTEGVADRFLAAALGSPVSVGDVAAEGGAWGMAVLASFALNRESRQPLADYLNDQVFADRSVRVVEPDPVDIAGFAAFLGRYRAALPVERAAIEHT